MTSRLQDGIYYSAHSAPGKSFTILFLRLNQKSKAIEVGNILKNLWRVCKNLEKGIVRDLEGQNKRHLVTGRLSTLIGYGPNMFNVKGARRGKPSALQRFNTFKSPDLNGGGPVLDGSAVKYAKDIHENHVASDDILIQFIADNEFYTNRAAVQVWRSLSENNRSGSGEPILFLTRIYSGFQRDDKRNWLGFHDGISNYQSSKRLNIIAIPKQGLRLEDTWIANGTYLLYMRIGFDLQEWDKLDFDRQQSIVGRDKLTGCPLTRVDKNKYLKDPRCPVRGTFEVTEPGNEEFRDIFPSKSNYYSRNKYSSQNIYNTLLDQSHVARANVLKLDQKSIPDKMQIFRQGFEFLEPLDYFNGIRLGLNFISFQNDPERASVIIKYGFKNSQLQKLGDSRLLEDFFSVRACGLFLVPPITSTEFYPGESIFLDGSASAIYDRNELKKNQVREAYGNS